MALRYPLVLNGTTIEELQSADSIDFTSASISGDLTFTGTGARVKANFSDATIANRLLFQTSTANSVTLFGLIPSGTGVSSAIYGSTNSDPTADASYFDLRVSGVTGLVRLTADRDGAAPYYPIAFFTGGSERVRIDTSGNFNIAGLTASRALATDASKNLVSSTVTSTELDYLSGVTSAIQTQLNSKAGTATANTFTNNQIISVNSSSDALRITQTGAGNALVVEDSANPDSTPFVINNSGIVGIGLTNPGTYTTEGLVIKGSANYAPQAQLWNAANHTSATYFIFKKDRAGAIVQNGDDLGAIEFDGGDGTTQIGAARIFCQVDGTPGTNDMPGRLVFSTTADSASSPTERMRINNAGNVLLGRTFVSGGERLGIGGSTSSISTTTSATGILNDSAVSPAQTNSYTGYNTFLSTGAASFTLANLRHFSAFQNTIGAGSTVTNQYGFLVDASLTGATTNYGFHSAIPSGSGRYNFYAAGTADNFFGGPVVVSTSSTSDALRITQTGTGNALLVEDSANPDSTPFVVNADGRVIIGNTSTRLIGGDATPFLIDGVDYPGSSPAFVCNANNANPVLVTLGKTRSATAGGVTIVQSGDNVGRIDFRGADGTALIQAAAITASVDGTPGLNDMPGRLVFSTTRDGASSPTEAFRVNSSQNTLFGRAYSSTERIGIGGGTSTISATTSAIGIANDVVVSSAQTTAYTANNTYLSTQAASFTLNNMTHYRANQSTIGAGSAVTNQMGFFADGSLTGANANHGFYAAIASGSGRYNFYAAGTAENYFAGAVGIGTAASSVSGTSLLITSDGLGAATSRCIFINPTFASTVTGSARGVQSTIGTAATAFTVANMSHFQAQQGIFGAGSVVTNQFGLEVAASLTGATNNYGVYSAIPSGTGRWNFYAAGNAENYFAGLILSNSSIKSNSATAGIGYGTGAGGTVTQTISRTTGVTLNKICGSVTVFSASATIAADFTVTNSTVSATDTIICSVQASGATVVYQATSYAIANGSFKIYMGSPGSATEAPTINFTVIKSVTA